MTLINLWIKKFLEFIVLVAYVEQTQDEVVV